jgi:hypothetical protein
MTHVTCGAWCCSLQNKGNPKELKKLHYCCKVEDHELYQQLLAIWEVYCTNESLKKLHPCCHTNMCELMNQFIAKFIHKSQHLCRTIMGRTRTYLAVSINSIGYKEYYRTMFDLLDFDYNKNFMLNHHHLLDNYKKRRNIYDEKPHVQREEATVTRYQDTREYKEGIHG